MVPVQGSVGPGFQLWRQENSYVSGVEIALFTRRLKSRNCKMDVHTLQQVFQEEMELHVVLENALEHAAVTLSDLSYLPNEAQDLLSNTPSLEMTVFRLEEEMISLHFQLIQERNERRLTEYQLKQLPAQPSKFAPAKNAANDTSSMLDREEKLPEKEFCQMSVEKRQLEYAAGALRLFRSLIEQLAEVNPVHLTGNEKLAFWINLYNALIMHAYLAYGVPKSDMKLFSLMQKALLLALHKLKLSEEQKKFSIETFEPLVAFALNWILSFEA
ncbi:hypothetical protein ZIOFF_049913 [Zingiber officinale]|uniref:DUF547 domain-containing protein n=1 Tax=Zingiber officinale TaxID=94328 RepID=A0A8J5FZP5_ZINOF|nr:hypothetical protein ZIOFF_049913 [Zingiber officinale]